jgi:hypothetical protein
MGPMFHWEHGTWDSIIHRYGREVGFTPANSQNINDSGNVRMQEVGADVNTYQYKPKNVLQLVQGSSQALSALCIFTHPDDPYTKYLQELDDETQKYYLDHSQQPQKMQLQVPRGAFLLLFMKCLWEDMTFYWGLIL